MFEKNKFPKRFPVDKLYRFDLGESDAFKDNRLFSAFCYTDFIESVRYSKKSLIVGPKGSGKSAVYKSFLKGFLPPIAVEGKEFVMVGISDELKYLEIDNLIRNDFSIYGYTEEYKYVLLWDFYLIFRMLCYLQESYSDNFSEELKALSRFFNHIDAHPESSFHIFLQKIKNLKFAASVTDGTTVYTGGIEYEKIKQLSGEVKFPLYSIKREINRILHTNGKELWVLIDKIDDFLIREKYDTQRNLLQGLVITEDSYSELDSVFIKIFMRSDLFEKLDLTIGADKIDSHKVDLKWRPSEIRRFIAQRLAVNILTILEIPGMTIEIEEDDLKRKKQKITEDNIADLKEQESIVSSMLKDQSQGRKISISDGSARRIITKIFPRKIFHYDSQGRSKPIDLFEFLETHLSLADKATTPRTILRFLELCIEKTRAYYDENPDEEKSVVLNEDKEYPLIKRESFQEAYGALSKKVWSYIRDYDRRWSTYIDKLYTGKGKKRVFTYRFLRDTFDLDGEELKQLLAFLTHIGLLACIGKDPKDPEKWKYELPILLQADAYYEH